MKINFPTFHQKNRLNQALISPGSKLFEKTLKEFFEKVDFEKKSADHKKHEQISKLKCETQLSSTRP